MKHTNCVLTISLLAIASTLFAADDRAVAQAFVASASGQFGTANPTTGQFVLIGFTPKVLSGLGIGPKKAIYGLDADNNLVTVNRKTAAATVVGGIGLPVQPNGNVTLFTSLGNGKLFAVDPFNKLYSINPSTGLAALIGSTGSPVPDFANCNCVTANSLAGAEGHLYFTFEVDDLASGKPTTPSALYRIDSFTAATNRVGATNAQAPIVGSVFIDRRLYGFTFGMPVNQPNEILAIDIETAAATFVTNQAPSLDPVFGATEGTRQD
jgi:hypothetical protein